MIKRLSCLLIVWLSMVFSLAAYANTKTGFYVGAQAGYGGMHTPKVYKSDMSYDLYGFAYRLHGGYLIGNNDGLQYGAELGFAKYDDNKYNLGEYESTGRDAEYKYQGFYIDFLGVIKYNFSKSGISVFGKAGAASVDQKTKISVAPPSNEGHKTKWLPKVAVGVGYNISDQLVVDLTCSYVLGTMPVKLDVPARYKTVDDINRVASVKTIMLGIAYHI